MTSDIYYQQRTLVTGVTTTPVTNVLSVMGVTTTPVTYFSFHQKFIFRVHISPAFLEVHPWCITKSQKHRTQNTQFIFRDHITYIYTYKYILAVTQIQCLLHITYILAGTQGQTKVVCLNQYRLGQPTTVYQHENNLHPEQVQTNSGIQNSSCIHYSLGQPRCFCLSPSWPQLQVRA